MSVPEKRVQKIQPYEIAFNNSFDGFIISLLGGIVNIRTHILSGKEGDKINNIRYYRKQARLTQLELADKLNVDRSAVTHWEKGTFQPNKEHIRKMARVLKCKKDELMGGDDS